MAVSMSFSKKENLKERISHIMKQNMITKKSKRLSFILSAFMILCSSFPAMAYEAPQRFDMVDEETGRPMHIEPNEISILCVNGVGPLWQEDVILYDSQFTAENGDIYKVNEFETDLYANCDHNYEDGIYSKHLKKADGSCVTKFYSTKHCSKCGHMTSKKLIRTSIDNLCPH